MSGSRRSEREIPYSLKGEPRAEARELASGQVDPAIVLREEGEKRRVNMDEGKRTQTPYHCAPHLRFHKQHDDPGHPRACHPPPEADVGTQSHRLHDPGN